MIIIRLAIINNYKAVPWCCRLDFYCNKKRVAVKYIVSTVGELIDPIECDKTIEKYSAIIDKAFRKL